MYSYIEAMWYLCSTYVKLGYWPAAGGWAAGQLANLDTRECSAKIFAYS